MAVTNPSPPNSPLNGLSPEDHEEIKNMMSDVRDETRGIDRIYLIFGPGGTRQELENPTKPGVKERVLVGDQLDARGSPPTAIYMLEYFDLDTRPHLWGPMFNVLAGESDFVVGLLVDATGSPGTEIGQLSYYYAKTWVLQREYTDDSGNTDQTKMRQKYDNGMAYSHLQNLDQRDQLLLWRNKTMLRKQIKHIP